MNIKYVMMHNFGPQAHFETRIMNGLVGIFGRNGGGKTHLVNGAYAALTNDFTRFDGVKTERIYRGAEPKEESFYELDAEHNGMEFTLRRTIRPNKSSLRIKGEPEITKATEIETRLRRDLGVDMKLIDTYVFVNQGKMTNFLSHTPSERAEAFKYLCGTQKADLITKACGELLGDSDLSTDVVDNSDELVTEIGRLEAIIAEHESERKKLEKQQLNEKSLATANTIVRKRTRYEEVEAELEEERTSLNDYQSRLKKRIRSQAAKYRSLNEHEATVAELKTKSDQATTALSVWSTYEKRRKRKKELTEAKTALEAEAGKKVKPEKPADYDQLEELRNTRSGLQTKLTAATDTLEGLQQGEADVEHMDKCKCPTCLQSVPLKFIKAQAEISKSLPPQIEELGKRISAITSYDQLLNSWKTWKAGYDARVKANAEELAGFKGLKEPDGDKADLQRDVNLHTTAVDALDNIRTAYDDLSKKVTQTETRVKTIKERIEKHTIKLSTLVVDDVRLERAKQRLAEHEAAKLAIAGVDGKLDEARKSLKSTNTTLEQLRVKIARRKKAQKAMKVLAKVNEAFHWSNLPRLVAQGNLFNMEQDINDSLSLFGNPFWAEADENLGFKVHFSDQNVHRAEGLSGGQKGVFAIAFRTAVNSLFGADIGMMWLDEPTDGLDEVNLAYFGEALIALAKQVRNKRQLVVVTHANSLRTSFDQVIEVA